MARIQLTRGMFVVVDDDVFEMLNEYSWHVTDDGYAAMNLKTGGTRSFQYVLMHRFLMDVWDPLVQVDHKDRNRLGCRRENLRVASSQGNARNRGKQGVESATSKYKGVCLNDCAAIHHFGEFAKTNFPWKDVA